MPDSAFKRPVPLFSPNPDGTVRRVELATVQEGFRALDRGLEGFCLDHPEWHMAFHSLSQAMLDPAPQRIEAVPRGPGPPCQPHPYSGAGRFTDASRPTDCTSFGALS